MTEQTRDKAYLTFQIDEALNSKIDDVVARVPGLTKSTLARVAISEKLEEISQKLESGEKVAVTV